MRMVTYNNCALGQSLLPNANSCAPHSEVKHTKKSECGTEKGLLHGHARSWRSHAKKNAKLPKGFQQSIFKGQLREGVTGYLISWYTNLWLLGGEVTGWYHRG